MTSKQSKKLKKEQISILLYKIIDKSLFQKFKELKERQTGGKYDKLVHIINNPPNDSKYKINNIRETCNTHEDNEKCNANQHCRWRHDNCYIALTKNMIVTFINKMSEDL